MLENRKAFGRVGYWKKNKRGYQSNIFFQGLRDTVFHVSVCTICFDTVESFAGSREAYCIADMKVFPLEVNSSSRSLVLADKDFAFRSRSRFIGAPSTHQSGFSLPFTNDPRLRKGEHDIRFVNFGFKRRQVIGICGARRAFQSVTKFTSSRKERRGRFRVYLGESRKKDQISW